MMGTKQETRRYGRCGSSMGFVIVVMMVMMILILAALSLAAAYVFRNEKLHNRIQADLTVRTVSEALVSDLQKPAEEGSVRAIIEAAAGASGEGTIRLEGLDEDMGAVTLDVHYNQEEGSLCVTVKVVLGDISREMKVVSDRETEQLPSAGRRKRDGEWTDFRYEEVSRE